MKTARRALPRPRSIPERHTIRSRNRGRRAAHRPFADARRAFGTRPSLLLFTIFALAGCAAAKLNAGFPDVALRAPLSGSTKIGVARVEDSRSDQVANAPDHLSLGIVQTGNVPLLVGPNLLGYIDYKFRNGLVDRGFDPVAALNPAKTALSQPYTVVVLTVQSVIFVIRGGLWTTIGQSSVSMAVQIYDAHRRLIFANSYSAVEDADLELTGESVAAGKVIAMAAEEAVAEALADPKLERALR